MRRVVVTGIGLVTPLGIGTDNTWRRLLAGESGLRSIQSFDVSDLPVRFKAPGDHVMPCQEFCGIGHQGMWGKVKVVDKTAFLNLVAAKRRLTCVD